MKKLLVIVAVLAISASSFAQVKFGVKAGTNIASITGDDGEGLDSRTSFVFGGFAKFELSEKFAFQPELLYSMQGAAGSESYEGVNVDVTMKTDYLNIPLMAKYYVTEGFSLQAGPQVGFLLSAKFKMEANGQEEEEDIKDQMKGVDFGLNFGAGYELDFGLGFDVRYNLGLTNVADYDEADGKNGVFQITASYAF
ncbi:porin family protein [Carboxylicivirga sp. N1Y90]|uniref:porin family protein n=1 Tax=Carboxylicivirga fragile TaxID=3417571 RepID=UPI003D325D89|nr:PorT family protein [Marinilabiliaceae bacterium N1Y90]